MIKDYPKKFYSRLVPLTGLVAILAGCNISVSIEDEVGGTVSTEDGLISCPDVICSYNYSSDQPTTTLIAEPDPGFAFSGFLEAETICENGLESLATKTCVVNTSSPKTVVATFTAIVGTMVEIPAGTFTMGWDTPYSSLEQPLHDVTVNAFLMGEAEVTWTEYQRCIDDGACADNGEKYGAEYGDMGWGRGDRPVINVNWHDVNNYIEWLNVQTGENYRLPTESEWEYAARAGTTTLFYLGDCISQEDANINFSVVSYKCGDDTSRIMNTLPAKSFAPNAWGLFDMYGNVGEWTEDCRNWDYDGAPTDGSAWLEGTCEQRVIRGGGWSTRPSGANSAARTFGSWRSQAIGFRLVKDI